MYVCVCVCVCLFVQFKPQLGQVDRRSACIQDIILYRHSVFNKQFSLIVTIFLTIFSRECFYLSVHYCDFVGCFTAVTIIKSVCELKCFKHSSVELTYTISVPFPQRSEQNTFCFNFNDILRELYNISII